MDTDKPPAKPKKSDSKATVDYRWVGLTFGLTILISALFSFISGEILNDTGIFVSFLVLLCIILIGILFDIIGVAVTAAKEQPFHSMAARKVPQASFALQLLRKANKVSSFCNDVIGDICGIISGSAAAAIAASSVFRPAQGERIILELLLSAFVAGLTVGGKAFGKAFAMHYSTQIVFRVSGVLYTISGLPEKGKRLFSRKNGGDSSCKF